MSKLIKILLSLIVVIILCVVVGGALLMTFVNPNRFKPLIIEQVQKNIGRQLTMDGNLSWSFYPSFGIKVGHVILNNPSGFQSTLFAELESATLSVKLLPLFHSKIESSGMTIKGLTLNLITNANGTNNWGDLKTGSAKTSPSNAAAGMMIAIKAIDVIDAKINWINQKTQTKLVIDKFNLTAKDVALDQSFPINFKFHALDKEREFNISGHSNILINSQNQTVSGKLTLNPFDISNPEIKNLSGDFDFATTASKKVSLKGDMHADLMQVNKVKITAIAAPVRYANDMLSLYHVTGNFYQGKINGDAVVNLSAAVPSITLYANLADVQIGPLVEDLGAQNKSYKIKGTGNIQLHTTTSGTDGKVLLQNLNGNGQFNISNGVLEGLDVGYLIQKAYNTVKGQPLSGQDTNQTQFSSLTGSVTITKGVVTNNDLLLSASKATSKGNGQIDLVNQQINYTLQTAVKADAQSTKNDIKNLYGITIPIRITGSLTHPNIGLDLNNLAQQAASKEFQNVKEKAIERVKQKAGGLLKNLLGN